MPTPWNTDGRLVETREGREITQGDWDLMSPEQRFAEYLGWTFGDSNWSRVFVDVMRNCGYQIQ